MKLQHKIAGTLLLPLAAATMATTAHAELTVGGYVAAEFSMDTTSATGVEDTNDTSGSAIASRINFKHTNLGSSNATVLFEGDYYGGNATGSTNDLRLRHAAVMVDGFTVGQYWSSAANLNALLPTIDFVGYTKASVEANRYAQIAYTLDMGATKVKFGVEDWGDGEEGTDGPSIPDFAAGVTSKMGGTSLFLGAAMVNDNDKDGKNTTYSHLAASAKVEVAEGTKLVAAYVASGNDEADGGSDESWTAMSAGVGLNLGGGISANAMYEVKEFGATGTKDQSTMFVNAFYKMPSGLQFGVELQDVTDSFNKTDTRYEDMSNINFQGKYAF